MCSLNLGNKQAISTKGKVPVGGGGGYNTLGGLSRWRWTRVYYLNWSKSKIDFCIPLQNVLLQYTTLTTTRPWQLTTGWGAWDYQVVENKVVVWSLEWVYSYDTSTNAAELLCWGGGRGRKLAQRHALNKPLCWSSEMQVLETAHFLPSFLHITEVLSIVKTVGTAWNKSTIEVAF